MPLSFSKLYGIRWFYSLFFICIIYNIRSNPEPDGKWPRWTVTIIDFHRFGFLIATAPAAIPTSLIAITGRAVPPGRGVKNRRVIRSRAIIASFDVPTASRTGRDRSANGRRAESVSRNHSGARTIPSSFPPDGRVIRTREGRKRERDGETVRGESRGACGPCGDRTREKPRPRRRTPGGEVGNACTHTDAHVHAMAHAHTRPAKNRHNFCDKSPFPARGWGELPSPGPNHTPWDFRWLRYHCSRPSRTVIKSLLPLAANLWFPRFHVFHAESKRSWTRFIAIGIHSDTTRYGSTTS